MVASPHFGNSDSSGDSKRPALSSRVFSRKTALIRDKPCEAFLTFSAAIAPPHLAVCELPAGGSGRLFRSEPFRPDRAGRSNPAPFPHNGPLAKQGWHDAHHIVPGLVSMGIAAFEIGQVHCSRSPQGIVHARPAVLSAFRYRPQWAVAWMRSNPTAYWVEP